MLQLAANKLLDSLLAEQQQLLRARVVLTLRGCGSLKTA